jgi:hypothetical protein
MPMACYDCHYIQNSTPSATSVFSVLSSPSAFTM